MDQHQSQAHASGSRSSEIARSLAAGRALLAEFEGENRRRLDALESQVVEKLERLQRELAGALNADRAEEQLAREKVARQLTEAQAKADSLGAARDQASAELAKREQEFAELRARNTSLQSEFDAFREERDAARNELKLATGEIEAERQKARQAEEVAAQNAANAEEARTRLRDLEQALGGERSQLERTVADLLAERDRAATQIGEWEARHAEMLAKLQDAQGAHNQSLRERDVQFAELAATVSRLQREIEERDAALQQARAETAERQAAFRDQRQALDQSLRDAAARLKEAEAARAALLSETEGTRQQAKNAQAELARRLSDAESARAALQENVDAAREEARLAQSALDAARSQAEEASKSRVEIERRLQGVTQDHERARSQLAGAAAEVEKLRTENAAHQRASQNRVPAESLDQAKRELESLRQTLAQVENKLGAVASERDSLQECLNEALARPANDPAAEKRLQAVAAERDRLADELAIVQEKLAETELAARRPSPDAEQMAKKYEMAISDLQDAKRKIADLERTKGSGGNAKGAVPVGAVLDWETQKRQLLEALEADCEGETEEEAADRLKMKDVVSRTDAVVDAKNKEIEELRHTLEQQSSSLGGVAVGAAALGQLLGQDEFIQHERERIAELKAEWEAKLRGAEVELSLQRAQVARDRAKLEEMQRALDHAGAGKGDTAKKAHKGLRAMMGLGDG